MKWKYKKGDIVMYNKKPYCIIVNCIEDSNNYHYYELNSLNKETFFTKFIDKTLLENNTVLDKKYNRQRKINRLINGEK